MVRKAPPILPEYCQQPSQAEETSLDEAKANSDPFVDQENNRWRTGHTVPAKNGTGMTYENEGTERQIVYNNKGIGLPPPRMPDGYQQRCSMVGCRVDQLLPQLPCFRYDPEKHDKWIHRCCFEEKILDRNGLLHPDPHQRREKGNYMQVACCTKACHTAYEKHLARNNAAFLPMEEDGPKGRHDPINSASMIMDRISNTHFWDCYTGLYEHKYPKVHYENKLAHDIAEAGIKKKRTGKDVKNFIQRKIEAWKKTDEWANNTGQGLKDAGEHKQFKDAVLKKCPHYYDMEHILSARAGVRPIMDSDTAHQDDNVLMGTDDTDGSQDSSGGEERRRNDREERARIDPEDRVQIERVQIDSAKKLSLREADAQSLDEQLEAHMEINVARANNIARVNDEHVFDMPAPRQMGGTGGVIDLAASFSSSAAASNKGGNAAVTAITASANNSVRKKLFSKKKKGAGLVASVSKKFTSTKKRRSSLSSVTDARSGRTTATSSLSRSRGISTTNKDKNQPDVILKQLFEKETTEELRKLKVQEADEVRKQKMFEIQAKKAEADEIERNRRIEREEKKAEAEEMDRNRRIEREDANFFFELLRGGMTKGQIKSFHPRLAKYCST